MDLIQQICSSIKKVRECIIAFYSIKECSSFYQNLSFLLTDYFVQKRISFEYKKCKVIKQDLLLVVSLQNASTPFLFFLHNENSSLFFSTNIIFFLFLSFSSPSLHYCYFFPYYKTLFFLMLLQLIMHITLRSFVTLLLMKPENSVSLLFIFTAIS